MGSKDLQHYSIFFLYSILPFLILYLTLVEINPTGVRRYHATLGRRSPVISQLFPAHRLAKIDRGVQRVLQEPIYFTIRYPHRYESAEVRVRANNPENISWQIGVEVGGGGDWSYYRQTPDASGRVLFDLSRARAKDRTLRFSITLPQVTDELFAVDDIEVTLHRPPIWRMSQK